MKVFWSPYELQDEGFSNSRSKNNSKGALLRFDFDLDAGMRTGYASIHPWEALGDESLPAQIDKLKKGQTSPLIEQARVCARVDAAFRVQGINAFDGLKLPVSHFLFSDITSVDKDDIKRHVHRGVRVFKIKVGRDLSEEARAIVQLFKLYPEIRLRLDANAKPSFTEASNFWQQLGAIRAQVECFEDPCPYDRNHWEALSKGCPLGLDFEYEKWVRDEPLNLSYLVLKPEAQDILRIIDHHGAYFERWMVTSYLGHALGTSWSAYCASQIGSPRLGVCGLGFDFTPSEGVGFGFEEELDASSWEEV